MKLSPFFFKQLCILLFLFICRVQSGFSQSKVYPSLLWEITGNGLQKPSYLYGTMHVSKKVAFHLTDAFFEDLKNTDIVALESNPETWLAQLMDESVNAFNKNLYKKYLPKNDQNFYENAFGFYVPTDKNIQYQISKEPEDVNGLLYRYNGYSANFEEQTYLDLFIMQAARKSGKNVASLEDFKTSMEMVTKASLPDDKEKINKKFVSDYTLGEKIESAYRNGDLDALDSLNKLTYRTKNFEKYMLLDRNKIMVHNMDSLMKKQAVFTAIGAAHLPGSEGVISLLRSMGYTVNPVKSGVSQSSIKLMAKYESKHTPLDYTTQFLADSTVKIDAPGKMYKMNEAGPLQEYLYTDMINGSYYVMNRIKTYGSFMEQNEQFQFDRVENMLYESIPGKIIRKKNIKANNGTRGIDILNKNGRGDYQRYQIFASEQYIYIFKIGGTGDYVKSSEFDKFFNSIKFSTSAVGSKWSAFTPPYGGYEISIPGNYVFENPKNINYQIDKLTATEGSDYFLCNRVQLNDYDYIEEDTFELNQLGRNFYEPLDYKLVSAKFNPFNSYPAVDIVTNHKSNGSHLYIKIILKDAQYYMLACKTNGEYPVAYFGSFRFRNFVYKPFETYKDTALHFSVSTDYKQENMSSLEKLIVQMQNLYSKKKVPSYFSWDEEKIIESPSTSESVKIEFYKFNDYKMDKSIDKLWKREIEWYASNTTLKIVKQNTFEKNKIPVLDLVITDTNTVKTIHARMFSKPGALYILLSTEDTLSKPSKWLSTFYDSFLPDDTALYTSSMIDKVPDFFKDIASTDSTTRDKVNELYDEIRFEDRHAESLMQFIAGKDFNNAGLPVKTSLISKLGDLKNPKIVPFLQREYLKYTDSASLQLSILNALTEQKTKEGNLAFVKLLKTESPLSDDQYAIDDIFNPFYDSLKIANVIFPAIIEMTRYLEYKNSIYNLLSTLLDSSLINSQSYLEQEKDILRLANEELKRQIASEENTASSDNYQSSAQERADTEAANEAMKAAMRAASVASVASGSYNSQNDDNYGGNNILLSYYNLLAPYYSEPAVKSSFDKAFRSKNKNFKIDLTAILLKNNLPVADTTINAFAKSPQTRSYLYETLKKIKKSDKIKPEYRTQNSLSYAFLYGSDTESDKADSIEFIGTRYVESPTSKGYIYFYTSKNKEGQKYIDYSGFQPKDSLKINTSPVVFNRNREIDKEKTIEKQIDDICYELSMYGRKRITRKGYDFGYIADDY